MTVSWTEPGTKHPRRKSQPKKHGAEGAAFRPALRVQLGGTLEVDAYVGLTLARAGELEQALG
jgi:hypothetical protein